MRAVALVVKALYAVDLAPIVVGGQALELYTFGSYTTSDVDLVLNGRDKAASVLEAIGFEKRGVGFRHWVHAALDLPIEIPDSVLLGSVEKASDVEIDGVSAYLHDLDQQYLIQAAQQPEHDVADALTSLLAKAESDQETGEGERR